jgi:hypothetical protein
MEGTAQATNKEQYMLKMMGRFIVLAALGIGACVLLGGLLLAFRGGSTSDQGIAVVGGQEAAAIPEISGIRPDRPAEQIAPRAPVIIPVQVEGQMDGGWMGPIVLLGAVAIISALIYSMFRMYLQYKVSHDIDESMFP